MSLTRNDIQILKEVFQPEFAHLHNKIDGIKQTMDKRFDQMNEKFEQVDKRFEQIDQRFEQIDQRFVQVDRRFEQGEETLAADFRQIIADIYELYPTRDEFNVLQTRVTLLEKRAHRQSSQ